MNANKLKQRWFQFVKYYSDDLNLIENEFHFLKQCYGQSHRKYHNLCHIRHLFEELEPVKPGSRVIQWAVWYHDIVYRPGSLSNETKSAQAAKLMMQKCGCSDSEVDDVYQMIIATQNHNQSNNKSDCELFLDADMAILGSNNNEYLKYTQQIRQEFSHLPSYLFNKGRKKFIQQTLGSASIYSTSYFHRKYEKQARLNLASELLTL